MSIKKKVLVTFLSLAIFSALSVTTLNFFCAKNTLLRITTKHLETLADLKINKIETFFMDLENDASIVQNYFNLKQNLLIVSQLHKNRNHPDFIKAKEMLDEQLRKWLEIKEAINDIMLVNPEGKIVYSANEKHLNLDLDKALPDPEGKAFKEGKKRIFISQIFKSADDGYGYKIGIFVTAPILDFEKRLIGVVVFEINMDPIYKYIQDIISLGETGETLVVKKEVNNVLFLNSLLYDRDSALKKVVQFGSSIAIPAQEAASGKNGFGVVKDYRNKDVVAVWR